MLFFYVCASLLTIFVGFRDAIGRNARIRKKKYYTTAVLRAFLFGQLILGTMYGSAYLFNVDSSVIDMLSERCRTPFTIYISLVLSTFIPYQIPNWEIKSLVTVLVFGPLTTAQPIVIIATMIYALIPLDFVAQREILWFVLGCTFCLFFERVLEELGWSKRDAMI